MRIWLTSRHPEVFATKAFFHQPEQNHHDSADAESPQHQQGCMQTKQKKSYLIHKLNAMQGNQILQYAEGLVALCRRRWWICPGNNSQGTCHAGSSCLGWLMSVDVYCQWVGCSILQSTAAFPIGLLLLNGQQTHNEAQMVEKWEQLEWTLSRISDL